MKSPVHPDIEMKKITRHGITIDYCPKSGGVWLDKGELEKLIEMELKSQKEEVDEEDNVPFSSSQTQNHKNNQNYSQNGHKHKKKESFLSEVFDFDFF